LKKEYTRRLRMRLKSELNVKNKIITGVLRVPVLRYRFGVVNRRLKGIKNIDRDTRNIVTVYKMEYPRAI
jgi:hypothetical protein